MGGGLGIKRALLRLGLNVLLSRFTKASRHVEFMTGLELWIPIEYLKREGDLNAVILSPFKIRVDDEVFVVPEGMDFDGASTPRAARSIVPRSGRILYGAAFHDAAYKGHFIMNRREADSIFFDINVTANVTPFKCWASWAAVRLLGWRYFNG